MPDGDAIAGAAAVLNSAGRRMRLAIDTASWIAVAFDVYDAELARDHGTTVAR
ncbi:MAG: hypothetical protein KA371_03325 [Acidobacteria bacterium]|nr:hypothetical protein [Acidobacteriota bacterium]